MDYPVFVVNGFEDRKDWIRQQIMEVGGVDPTMLEFVRNPNGDKIRSLVGISDHRMLKACRRWLDPFTGNPLKWGQMACFHNHLDIWNQIGKMNRRGAFVFEDDVVVKGPINAAFRGVRHPEMDSHEAPWEAPPLADVVMLGWKEIEPFYYPQLTPEDLSPATAEKTVNSDDARVARLWNMRKGLPDLGLPYAGYVYWTCGYWISRDAARRLVDAFAPGSMIPTDEFLPYHSVGECNPNVDEILHGQAPSLGLNILRLREPLVEPSGKFGSATESSPFAFDLRVLVFATDIERARECLNALRNLGFQSVEVLGVGRAGWDSATAGGGAKLDWIKEYLDRTTLPNDAPQIIMALDGYDTLPVRGPGEIVRRFLGMGVDFVIGGERACWPADDVIQGEFDHEAANSKHPAAPFKYPNSGCYIGFAEAVQFLINQAIHKTRVIGGKREPDQASMQLTLIRNSKSGSPWQGKSKPAPVLTFRVDSEGYLFLNLKRSGASRWRGFPYILETHCSPAVIHGNGGAKMDISRPIPWADPVLDKRAFEYVEHVPGVLAMPFLDPAWCSQVVGAAVGLDLWEPLAGDKVPGDELRLRALDCWLFEWLDKELADSVKPIIDRRWFPSRWSNIKDSFFIRYSADRQPEIRLHEDSSHFSCSVKMRKTCCGGELWFPRQNYSDRLIPLGWLLVWPSRITHPHQVTPVAGKGDRVSLVVWTKQ